MTSRIIAGLLLLAAATSLAQADDMFGKTWYDGRAELDGYKLVVSRYGENRADATAVMIFVTEPFSESKRVKVNDANANPKDTFTALKLNLVRDFQTGIYDYNTMVSLFVRAETLEPAKISFTSSEWCGHVYNELIFKPREIRGTYASYFEGESGPEVLGRPKDGITEDELFIALRSLRGEFMPAGETQTVPYLPGVFHSRLSHKLLEWTRATIARAAKNETIAVPAGSFEVTRYDVSISDGRAGVFYVETTYPHRIIKWSLPPDVSGELTGSKRLEYWRLHSEGDESYLKDIGLAPAR